MCLLFKSVPESLGKKRTKQPRSNMNRKEVVSVSSSSDRTAEAALCVWDITAAVRVVPVVTPSSALPAPSWGPAALSSSGHGLL